MNQPSLLILFLLLMFFHVAAFSPSRRSSLQQDAATNFQPSVAVAIAILAVIFSLTCLLLAYARFCHRASSVHDNEQSLDRGIRLGSRFSGVDKTVIESLPFFRFSSLRGSREGLECAVCLSRFEDVEVLRLLPKCKHAFHINCIDLWLERHSSCPLCRHKISADDLASLAYSSSLRFLSSHTELREDSNIELFVQREEEEGEEEQGLHGGSSRFSIGSSFRRANKSIKEEELPIQENSDFDENQKPVLHKFNHRIIVPDVVFKNRWSSVSSSDLVSLNSEMLAAMSNNRFSSSDPKSAQPARTRVLENSQIMKIKEEMERKRVFESKLSKMSLTDSFQLLENKGKAYDQFSTSTNPRTSCIENVSLSKSTNYSSQAKPNSSYASRALNPADKRSMSEITVHPRFIDFGVKNSIRESSLPENDAKEERLKRLWLPIARRTVQWFANRERRSHHSDNRIQSSKV
ncbi:E3 ubiquitin-protein ligase ATL42-like [Diospyros lotus]|uniref:E3 ubiquitin-protein ligase ATL42-like n=1 Tax=Diospyros lotus TaxID=55363 RepID=UPI00224EF740|nr:E3 ubiquitin-protein ligase ATL42-like [Diospyros lotus]